MRVNWPEQRDYKKTKTKKGSPIKKKGKTHFQTVMNNENCKKKVNSEIYGDTRKLTTRHGTSLCSV